MIFDSLQRLIEKNPDQRLTQGLVFLRNVQPDIATGRHELSHSAYAMVDEYETVPEDSHHFEAHEAHIDIQMVLSGVETIQWCDIDRMKLHTPYTAADDYALFTVQHESQNVQNLIMTPGLAAVFYPSDTHRPGLIYGRAHKVKKIVVKIPC